MKRRISLLLTLSLLLSLLSACQQPAAQSEPPVPSPSQTAEPSVQPTASAPAEEELLCNSILNSLWPELGFEADKMDYFSAGVREPLAAYIEGAYGLTEDEWEDAGICRKTGASAEELAVLRFADESAAAHGEECLQNYLHGREGDFAGYAPEQALLVTVAVVCRQGPYVGLFICENPSLARFLFVSGVEDVKNGIVPGQGRIQDVNELLDRLLDLCREAGYDVPRVEQTGSGDREGLKAILEGEYGLPDGSWEAAAVARGTDGSVFELAVLNVGNEQAARDASQRLDRYLDAREEKFAGSPAQAELLHDAVACRMGKYCVLLVCESRDREELILWKLMDDMGLNSYVHSIRHQETNPGPAAENTPDIPNRVKFVQPNKDDMTLYDTSAIRAAWAQGDPSGLSDYDRAVYDSAERVLGEILTEGMSDLEKEQAAYAWLTDGVVYDWTHQDIMRETPRESFTPYGGLVNRVAVCLGYATSFQLLMDLAGVECITVVGAAFNSEEDHAWNMVRLNGNWYCVDVTWDANGREQLGDSYAWRYFNVTSDEMAKNHQWDYANIPEATAKDRGQG